MSGVGSTLIAVAVLTVLSAWLLLVLKPWRHPQHAARYRPDPVTPPALEDTVTFAPVEGRPPWDLAEGTGTALVFGTAGAMGCDSGAMAAVNDGALHHEVILRREMALPYDLPGEDGPPVDPPSGPPAGAGCVSEGSGPAAPPAPVPCSCGKESCWLEELFRDPPRWLEET